MQTPHRDGVLAEITLAAIHVQAGEPDGPSLARRAIAGVRELSSARTRARLAPLIAALEGRPSAETADLARSARQVRATAA